MVKAAVYPMLLLLVFEREGAISRQVICEFAFKGDFGELFEQRCERNLHCNCMQLLCIPTVCQRLFC